MMGHSLHLLKFKSFESAVTRWPLSIILTAAFILPFVAVLRQAEAQATNGPLFCAALFSGETQKIPPSLVLDKQARNRMIVETLRGSDTTPPLLFTWKVNRPEGLRKRPDGGYEVAPLNDPSVEYWGNPFDTESPLTRVRRILSSPHPLPRFYDSVYAHYETRIRDELVQLVERIEKDLPEDRQSWGEVLDPITKTVIGTVRLFDGTVARGDDLLHGARLESQAEDRLVFERILAARGLESRWSKALQQIKRNHPFQKIFEIGKFSLEKNAPPELRERALKMLELFMLDHYLTLYPDAIFFAHTASEAHRLLYMRRYGFKVVDEIKIPGTGQPEQILIVTAKKLREKISKRLNLPATPTTGP
jgi:hypothetical protein